SPKARRQPRGGNNLGTTGIPPQSNKDLERNNSIRRCSKIVANRRGLMGGLEDMITADIPLRITRVVMVMARQAGTAGLRSKETGKCRPGPGVAFKMRITGRRKRISNLGTEKSTGEGLLQMKRASRRK